MENQPDMLMTYSLLSPNNITNVSKPDSDIATTSDTNINTGQVTSNPNTPNNTTSNRNRSKNDSVKSGDNNNNASNTTTTPHNNLNSPNNGMGQSSENFNLDNFEIWNNFTVLHDLNQYMDNNNGSVVANDNSTHNNNANNTNNTHNNNDIGDGGPHDTNSLNNIPQSTNRHNDNNSVANDISHSNYSNSLTDNSTTGLTPITGDFDNDSPINKNLTQNNQDHITANEISGFFNDFDSILKGHQDTSSYHSTDLHQAHSMDKALNQDMLMDSEVINTKEIFTPLISPAVMPLDRSHHSSNVNGANSGTGQNNNGNRFSPLTSPALGYMSSRMPTMRTKRLSSQDPSDNTQFNQSSNNGSTNVSPNALPPFNSNSNTSTSMSPNITDDDQGGRRSSYKRSKTPITTPIFGPTNPSNSSNNIQSQQTNGSTTPNNRPVQSPIILARHSNYHRRYSKNKNQAQSQTQTAQNSTQSTSSTNLFDMLPESASNFANNTNNTNSLTTNSNNNANQQNTSAMMPPPSTYNPDLSSSLNPVTPAVLMSKIPLNGSANTSIKSRGNSRSNSVNSTPLLKPTNNAGSKDNLIANPNHLVNKVSVISSSPVILPSSNHTFFNQNAQQFSLDDDNGNINMDVNMELVSSSERRRSSVGSSSDKKVNHKLAEQGRRNRMNIAIQELEKLIPDYLKNEVIVPSKATTVEQASKFIIHLQEQIQRLKQNIDDTSSISPLEYDDPNNNSNATNFENTTNETKQ